MSKRDRKLVEVSKENYDRLKRLQKKYHQPPFDEVSLVRITNFCLEKGIPIVEASRAAL